MNHVISYPVTIRPAHPDDAPALWRLAALDSAAVPAGPLLLAEVGDELRAAVSMSSLAAIADPFVPTASIVQMLRDHIGQTRRQPGRQRELRRLALPAAA